MARLSLCGATFAAAIAGSRDTPSKSMPLLATGKGAVNWAGGLEMLERVE